MGIEKMGVPSPEEQSKIQEERTREDVNIIKGGGEYKEDGHIEITAEQMEAVKKATQAESPEVKSMEALRQNAIKAGVSLEDVKALDDKLEKIKKDEDIKENLKKAKEAEEAKEVANKEIEMRIEAKREQIKLVAEKWIENEENKLKEERKGQPTIYEGTLIAGAVGSLSAITAGIFTMAKAGASFDTIGKIMNGIQPSFMSDKNFQAVNDMIGTPMLEAGIATAVAVFAISMTPRIKRWLEERKLRKQKIAIEEGMIK